MRTEISARTIRHHSCITVSMYTLFEQHAIRCVAPNDEPRPTRRSRRIVDPAAEDCQINWGETPEIVPRDPSSNRVTHLRTKLRQTRRRIGCAVLYAIA